MKITITRPDLFAAVSHAVSTEKLRYYLGGVFIQRAIGGGLLYTATDGHRLLQAHDAAAVMEEADSAIIGCKPKIHPKLHKSDFSIWVDGRLDFGDWLLAAKIFDGVFPDYTRVIPDKCSGVTAQFNAKYLSDMQGVANILDAQHPCIHHNGNGPALVSFGLEPIFGVIMPVRVDSRVAKLPKAVVKS
jgi:DNA polymerase-3 subunit beta